MPLISAVDIGSGTILNTTVSNSTLTFSFIVSADIIEIQSTFISLTNVNFSQGSSSYNCDLINYSELNGVVDSASFPSTFDCDLVVNPRCSQSTRLILTTLIIFLALSVMIVPLIFLFNKENKGKMSEILLNDKIVNMKNIIIVFVIIIITTLFLSVIADSIIEVCIR